MHSQIFFLVLRVILEAANNPQHLNLLLFSVWVTLSQLFQVSLSSSSFHIWFSLSVLKKKNATMEGCYHRDCNFSSAL